MCVGDQKRIDAGNNEATVTALKSIDANFEGSAFCLHLAGVLAVAPKTALSLASRAKVRPNFLIYFFTVLKVFFDGIQPKNRYDQLVRPFCLLTKQLKFRGRTPFCVRFYSFNRAILFGSNPSV